MVGSGTAGIPRAESKYPKAFHVVRFQRLPRAMSATCTHWCRSSD